MATATAWRVFLSLPPKPIARSRSWATVIVTAVRWYLSYALSARQVTELLSERGIDVSARTVLTWTQTFGPQLATAARRHRRRLGRRWYINEVFLFHGTVKRYLYRAVDEHGQVLDVPASWTWPPPRKRQILMRMLRQGPMFIEMPPPSGGRPHLMRLIDGPERRLGAREGSPPGCRGHARRAAPTESA